MFTKTEERVCSEVSVGVCISKEFSHRINISIACVCNTIISIEFCVVEIMIIFLFVWSFTPGYKETGLSFRGLAMKGCFTYFQLLM